MSDTATRNYTAALCLCDDEGTIDILKLNALRALGGHDPYPDDAEIQCTGSAHLAGERIFCTSTAHRRAGMSGTHAGLSTFLTTEPA